MRRRADERPTLRAIVVRHRCRRPDHPRDRRGALARANGCTRLPRCFDRFRSDSAGATGRSDRRQPRAAVYGRSTPPCGRAGAAGRADAALLPSGVWVNRRSPTAAADRIVLVAGSGARWTLLTRGHSYRWHDHRLSPPADLQPGGRRAWSLPITVDGRPATIRGWYERVRRPRWWAWLAAIVLAGGALRIVARRVPNERGQIAAVLATALRDRSHRQRRRLRDG